MTTHHSAHELQKKIGSLEAELAVLKKCSAIVLADQGFDEAARSIFKACKEAAGATAGYVALLSEDDAENEVLFLDTGGLPCAVAPQLPIRGLRAEAYRDGKTVYANDFASSRSAGFMPAGHVELKNVMFAPMAIGQHVVGLLILANKPVDFTPRDAATASVCAEFTAIALMKTRLEDDRRRSGQSLIESEDRFRKLYAAMNEGVGLHEITLDAAGQPVDYRLLEVNVAYERITGLKREAIAGRRATEVYGVDDAPFLDTYAQVAETGAPTSFEIHWAPMDKHLLVSVFSPRKGQFATVFTDITHLKVKEEQLRISEEYLATTLDAIGDAVITTDRGGRVLLMNPVAEALTGWRLSEARGNPLDKIFAIYHEKTRNRMENPALKVLKAGGRVGLAKHTILVSKDGTEYFIDDSAAPIRSENGDVIGVVLIFRDISEKYQSEAALRRSEAKHKKMISNISDVIAILDADSIIRYISPNIEKWFGWEPKDLIGTDGWETVHPDDRERIQKEFNTLLGRDQAEKKTEYRFKCRDGNYKWIELTAVNLVQDSMINGMLVNYHDVTDRSRAEAALRTSEEKFRLTFNASPDAVNVNRLEDGLYVEINEGFTQLTGYTHDDVAGKTSLDISIWHDPADRQKLARGLREKGFYRNLEARFKRKDGSLTTALMSARVITLEGEPHVISVTRDISERKQAEAERERLLLAIEQANEVIVITDASGKIQYVNPAFGNITGYSCREAIGQNPRLLKSGRHDRAFYKNLWDTILAGQPWSGRLINKRKDGTLYTCECSISPVKDKAGIVTNFVWMSHDITKELELEKKMIQVQKMEALGALAGGIAHDFNNLLFPITGMSEMLMEDLPADSMNHEHVAEILKAAHRAGDLVNQILSFSRQSDHQKKPVRIQQVLREVLTLTRATIPSNIEINQKIQNDCGLVMADPTQVHQIAMNLMTNAFHAVEQNGGKISIALVETSLPDGNVKHTQLEPGRYARMSVADTGHGIPPELLGKIFEPYFTTKPQGKGTGLGLSTVYGIVRQHNGDITVASQLGQGTTMNIYLPLIVKTAPAEAAEPAEYVETGNERILLVDDEEPIVRLGRQMLERLGYRVTSRVSSLEALEAFKANPDAFDLVITDMTMPNMTGDQLAKALISHRPDIPVVVCTGFSERMDPQRAQAIGIKGFLMKPVTKSDMARMVRKALDG